MCIYLSVDLFVLSFCLCVTHSHTHFLYWPHRVKTWIQELSSAAMVSLLTTFPLSFAILRSVSSSTSFRHRPMCISLLLNAHICCVLHYKSPLPYRPYNTRYPPITSLSPPVIRQTHQSILHSLSPHHLPITPSCSLDPPVSISVCLNCII